ncbi:uridylate kinase [Aminithiophilus ramosus]|uniref:Uridylate kinase n=1 Tax=Aminithiophilus ramosus TaxID=3029084 RepID=A0A9Q7AR08_9BACT|nr:uridylate kinase [Aminithiophilus ramosus]QTX32451.1 uridylate kinase [Aminithiophilus ramosus]
MIGIVKIGGAVGNDTRPLLDDLARRVGRGERWVVVHGASGVTDSLCELAGVACRYVTSPSGYRSRYVGPAQRALFEAAALSLSGRLSSELALRGIAAPVLRPDSVPTVRAERKDLLRAVEGGRRFILRDNYSGTVRSVAGETLEATWRSGALPLLPPLAFDEESGLNLNVDGDRLAASVALAVDADCLVILTNVAGLMEDLSRPESLVTQAGLEDWDHLERMAQGNMKRKLLACREALEGGLARVVLADSRREAPLSHAVEGGGTQLWRQSPALRSMAVGL